MYKTILSMLLFLVFALSYLLKIYIMRINNNIQAIVLAKGNKEKKLMSVEKFLRIVSCMWVILWLFSLSVDGIRVISKRNFKMEIINGVGIVIIILGIIFFELAIVTMKNSWRVGIDKTTQTQLITIGIYKYSRNPAFVGIDLMVIGVFILYPSLVAFLIMSLNLGAIHLQIYEEEKHLLTQFGERYDKYMRATPRYLFIR